MVQNQKKLNTYLELLDLLGELKTEKRFSQRVDELKSEVSGELKNAIKDLKSNEIKQMVKQLSQQAKNVKNIQLSQASMTKTSNTVQVEMLKTLKEISGYQANFAKHYAMRNPIPGDEPINKRESKGIATGENYLFAYDVPSGQVFNFVSMSITYNKNSTYKILIDGVYDPALSEPIQQWGNNNPIYDPPEKAYHKVEIEVTNNSKITQTYNSQIKGFFRKMED